MNRVTPPTGVAFENRPPEYAGRQAHAWARIGVISFAALVVAQVFFVLAVVPRLADGYLTVDAAVGGLPRAIITLSDRHLLAPLLVLFDAVLFGAMYLLSRRHGWAFLLVPAIVLLLIAGPFLLMLYTPIFETMNSVK